MKLKLFKLLKGQLADLALGVIIAIVSLYIGLFMISKVSDIAAIDNKSAFYTTFTGLTTSTGTIYDVLVLVVIIVALGVAIAVLRGFGASAPSPAPVTV